MSRDCDYRDVNASEYQNEAIRDALIDGLLSHDIRQRLLENSKLTLAEAFSQARSLELAQKHSESYTHQQGLYSNAIQSQELVYLPEKNIAKVDRTTLERNMKTDNFNLAAIPNSARRDKCYFCGYNFHPRDKCTAKDAICYQCGTKGHFSRVCRSKGKTAVGRISGSAHMPVLSTASTKTGKDGLAKATHMVTVDGKPVEALFDSGSTENFIDHAFAIANSISIYPTSGEVLMAATALSIKISGYCVVTIVQNVSEHLNVNLFVMENLCKDVILGLKFMELHNSFTIVFGGGKSNINICGLISAEID